MKIVFQREEAMPQLSKLVNMVEKTNTVTIVSHFKGSVEGTHITWTATDLEMMMKAFHTIISGDEGDFTIPARKFFDMCRALPTGSVVELNISGDKIVVKTITGRFNLLTLAADEFPEFSLDDNAERVELDARIFRRGLINTNFCMAQQDIRYYLMGTLVELCGDKLRLVATDSFRFAISRLLIEARADEEVVQGILPKKSAAELERLLADVEGNITIAISRKNLVVHGANFFFCTKLVDKQYPEYSGILRNRGSKELRCDRKLLSDALTRVSVLSNEKDRAVKVVISEEGMNASFFNHEQESAEELIDIEYQGPVTKLGFNVQFLKEILAHMDKDEVAMEFEDEDSGVHMLGDASTGTEYVLMPLKI